MKVDIEHTSSLVRVWYRADAKYGDSFNWCATVRWISKEEVEFVGAMTAPNQEAWRAIQDHFAEMGVKRILMIRYKRGRKRERWIDTDWRAE